VLKNPPEYPLANHHVSHHVAHGIKEGRQKINVYMLYVHNPLYNQPDVETWREVLSSEKLIPFFVSININMDEATHYADIILPDTTFLERWDPESMPSSVLGWVGLRQPVIKPLGNARSVREILYDLANKIDPDGKRRIKRYFAYRSAEEYVKTQLEATPGLKEAGGFDFLKKYGVFPLYDKKKEENFKFGAHEEKLGRKDLSGTKVDGRTIFKGKSPVGLMVDGKAVKGFNTPTRTFQVYVDEWKHFGFEPMPHYEPIKAHKEMKKDGLIMVTYKVNVHTQARTSNLKWLQEIHHKNPMWINTETAAARGIKDEDLVRITSQIGYVVTRARVTEGIHPKVIATAHSAGRSGVTKGSFGASRDRDRDKNVWWDDEGVHPNMIYPIATDPIGGSFAWFDAVVSVTKAKPGDRYGQFKTNAKASRRAYKAALGMTTKVRGGGGGHA
jgi:anaerobic selenocysteine-containing dehydrogenase